MKTILSSIKAWVNKQFRQSIADWEQNDSSALNYIKNKRSKRQDR